MIYDARTLENIIKLAHEFRKDGVNTVKEIVEIGEKHEDASSGLFIMKYRTMIKEQIDFINNVLK